VLACCLAAALQAGCRHPAIYDGRLAPGYTRVTVTNETNWQCGVTIERIDKAAGTSPATITGTLGPHERYAWDLKAGEYDLTATRLTPPVKGFVRRYNFKPNSHFVWPMLDLSKPAKP